MKHLTKALCLIVIFFSGMAVRAQNHKADEIVKSLNDYFFLERENIHVQANKDVYFTNEAIWVKGYVYHRKKGQPFFSSTNIQAALIDSGGKVIETKLLYGNLGSFTGNFPLSNALPSGKYYLQFYTNWMNNFSEDESFVKEISIINENDNPANTLRAISFSEIKINIVPEGGTYLRGVANTFGISVTGCDESPAPISTVDVVGQDGKSITRVQLNKLGNGRFELPSGKEPAKVVATINGKLFETPFPQIQNKGFALNANSYSIAGSTTVNVTTNSATGQEYAGKPVYLAVHRDDKVLVFQLNFDAANTKQSVSIPSTELPEGLNTIRLLDNNLKELAVRMIYNYPVAGVSSSIKEVKKQNGDIKIAGNVTHPNMNLSISVLPDETISADDKKDIYGSLLIAPYIKGTPAGRHYFTTLTKGKHYELDIYLLTQQPKYSWYNIMNTPPKHLYTFDMGLTLKGRIPEGISYDNKTTKLRLFSPGGLNEYVRINDNREFEVDHLVVQDSMVVNFSLVKVNDKNPKELRIIPQIVNGRTKYNKMYQPNPPCDLAPPDTDTGDYAKPDVFINTVVLDEVSIKGSALKHARSFGNTNLSGYKMSDYKASYMNVLTWLKLYSTFDVVDNAGEVAILSRSRTSIRGASSGPIIYIDNMQVIDVSMLRNIQISEVDELYMNAQAIVPSIRNFVGMIKIYLKKGGNWNGKNKTHDVYIKNAFQRLNRFENIPYISTSGKAFNDFGIIHWEPAIMTDENGNFKFDFPEVTQKKIKLLIEGFSADGKLISEIKTIDIN